MFLQNASWCVGQCPGLRHKHRQANGSVLTVEVSLRCSEKFEMESIWEQSFTFRDFHYSHCSFSAWQTELRSVNPLGLPSKVSASTSIPKAGRSHGLSYLLRCLWVYKAYTKVSIESIDFRYWRYQISPLNWSTRVLISTSPQVRQHFQLFSPQHLPLVGALCKWLGCSCLIHQPTSRI